MKKTMLGFAFALLTITVTAQDIPDYDAIKLDVKEDYTAEAEAAALKAANYLFSTALEKDNINRLKSLQYIIKWMSGTPDYSFSLESSALKLTKKDSDLLGMYMAALAKYVLENKADAKDINKVNLNAVKLLLAYARDEKNKVKIAGELKKAIAADDKGELAGYLGIK